MPILPILYMYLDNKLIDIEYLCYLSHAMAKFKYAYDQGRLQVRIFLELIAKLYGWKILTAGKTIRRRDLPQKEQ